MSGLYRGFRVWSSGFRSVGVYIGVKGLGFRV